MKDYYQTLDSLYSKTRDGTTPQGTEIDITPEVIELTRGISGFRNALTEAMYALDIAQVLLGSSAHHHRILAAYRQTRAAIEGE
jgi:hypothetical protein